MADQQSAADAGVAEIPSEIINVIVKLPASEPVPEVKFQSTFNESIESVSDNITLLPFTSHLTCFDLGVADKDGKVQILPGSVIIGELLPEEQGEHLHDQEINVVLQLLEKNYTQKDVREHLVKVREISGLSLYESLDPLGPEYAALGSGISKFSEWKLNEKKFQREPESEKTEANKEVHEVFQFTEEDKSELSSIKDRVVDNFKTADNTSHNTKILSETTVPSKIPQLSPALKSLSLSGWNPVTSYNKLNHGHLLYLQVQTLEGETFHITATLNGFYLNNCSNSKFDPSINATYYSNLSKRKQKVGNKAASDVLKNSNNGKFHSLHNLIQVLSDQFQEVQDRNKEILVSNNPLNFLVPSNSFLSSPWIINQQAVEKSIKQTIVPDLGKTQNEFLVGGKEASDLYRDWNSDYQSFVELSKKSLPDRINRERLLNKIGFEFSRSATKNAIGILNGELAAFNPIEVDNKEKIYLRNNILYSHAIDADGHYAEIGGEECARVAVKKDLNTIKKLNKLDDSKVKYTLTSIVDYAGHRIVCQAPIPGIFNLVNPLTEDDIDENGNLISKQKEGEENADEEEPMPINRIAYGLSEDFDKVYDDNLFAKSFKSISEYLHLKKHAVWTGSNKEAKELVTSLDTKGLKGSDERLYIIDLFKSTPLDIEFVEDSWGSDNSYPYKQVFLRHELVDEWFSRNVALEINKESEKLAAKKDGETKADEKEEESEKADGEQQPKLTIDASKFQFNPDAFLLKKDSIDQVLSEEQLKQLKEDEEQVRSISGFLREKIIPEFLEEVLVSGKAMVPLDGEHLTSTLHKQGINIRYLGLLAEKTLELKKQREAETKSKLELIESQREQAEKDVEEKKRAAAAAAGGEAEKSEDKKEDQGEEEERNLEDFETSFDLNNVDASYNSFYKVIIQEIIARASKHVLRYFSTPLPLEFTPSIIAHFLNLLLGFDITNTPKLQLTEFLTASYPEADLSSLEKLTSEDLIALVAKEANKRFRIDLSAEEIKKFVRFNAVSLLREISIKFGFQLDSKNYAFDKESFDKSNAVAANSEQATAAPSASDAQTNGGAKSSKKNKKKKSAATQVAAPSKKKIVRDSVFVTSDVINLIPKIDDSTFNSSLSQEIWNLGREYVYNGLAKKQKQAEDKQNKESLEEGGSNEEETSEEEQDGDDVTLGISLLHESLSLQEQVYGSIHPKLAEVYGNLSTIYSDLGEIDRSVEYIKKAIIIGERVNGIDSYKTILSLVNLAFLENLNGNYLASLDVYGKLLSILQVKCNNNVAVSEDKDNLLYTSIHPLNLTIASNIALIYSSLDLFKDSLDIFKQSIDLSTHFNGAEANYTLMMKYQYCQCLLQNHQFADALREYNGLYHQLRKTLGDKHQITRDCKGWVEKLVKFTFDSSKQTKQLAKIKELQRQQQGYLRNTNKSSTSNDSNASTVGASESKKNKKSKKKAAK